MASIDEFITSVQSNVEALKQAQVSMDGAKQQAEELSSQFQSLGAESMATGAHGLKEGVEQAQSGVAPVITQLEQLITQAQGLKSLRGTGGADTHTRPPPTPLDAAPAALKEPVAQVGDQVTAPESKPGAFNAELKSDDEDDQRMNKFRRAGRIATRNAGSIKDQLKTSAEVRFDKASDFDPPETYPTVGVAAQPQIHSANPGIAVQDIVGTAAIMAVVAAEGLSRILGKKKG